MTNLADFIEEIMNFLAIIPARYHSTRFPGKPLANISGKSMITRVYEQASKAFDHVIVATDDNRILLHMREAGGKAVMTSARHQSGTDRCYEALVNYRQYTKLDFDAVINIQGDEPFVDPEQLTALTEVFGKTNTMIATLVKELHDEKEIRNPNVVKVVISNAMNALYFSRHPVPYKRNDNQNTIYYKHLGIYAYRAEILEKLTRLSPSMLEKTEGLEQLRWLENDFSIRCRVTSTESISIDTPEDLEKAEQYARQRGL